jgi:hypothetical protein
VIPPPQGITAADYEALEAAVMETERGRWFLAEFVRRRRAEDTARILTAINRLEARVAEADAAEARTRLEADRAARLLGELAALLRDLRPLRETRAPPSFAALPTPDAPEAAPRNAGGELEARLAALAKLDALDVEKKLDLFS